jgi:hypothetical protein
MDKGFSFFVFIPLRRNPKVVDKGRKDRFIQVEEKAYNRKKLGNWRNVNVV